MNFILNMISILVQVILYPIYYIKDLVIIALDNKTHTFMKILVVLAKTILLLFYILGVMCVTNILQTEFIVNMISPIPVLIESGEVDLDNYESVSVKATNSSNSVSFGGGVYSVDMSQIDSSISVSLPTTYWQNGTPYQRIQLLLIVEEICAREEITCTPEQLLGFYYAECTAYIPSGKDMINTTWVETYNAYNCGGPFQHNRDAWESTGDYRGRAFISKLENSSIEENSRVQTSDNCNLEINGMQRPCMFYFPDAAYSAALRISKHMDTNSKTYRFTGEMYNWGINNGFNKTQADALRVVSAGGYYNGYTGDVKSYIPPMYMDIYSSNNGINSWYNLANSRDNLNSKLKELMKLTPRKTPDFKSGFSNYATYEEALVNGNWQSMQFAFCVFNGGKYVYSGLTALASQLPQADNGVPSEIISGEMTEELHKVIEWAESQVGKRTFIRPDTNIELVSLNWCASFVSSALYKGVGKYHGGNADAFPYSNKMPTDYNKIPAGATIVSNGTGGYEAHVALCIGNGYVIEAGGSIIKKQKISESYGAKNGFWGWGVPYNFESNGSGGMSSEKFNQLYSVMKTCYGKPYVYGTSGPNSFDCSGFVWYVYQQSKLKNWSRVSADSLYRNSVTIISKDELAKGDLIFYTPYGEPNSKRAGHVSIYIGNNKEAHAPTEGKTVGEYKINNNDSNQKILGYGRIK